MTRLPQELEHAERQGAKLGAYLKFRQKIRKVKLFIIGPQGNVKLFIIVPLRKVKLFIITFEREVKLFIIFVKPLS